MKYTLLFAFGLTFFATSAHAQSGDFPAGTPASMGGIVGSPAPAVPEYLNSHVVPLSSKEMKALQLSDQWAKTDIAPVLSSGGKIIYIHGAVMPSIIGAPMQVCDVELQPGEKVREIVVGDSARWLIESGTSGFNGQETVHLFIKPIDSGLESSAIVTTDRRTYHLRLISRKSGHTPYVGFQYSDQMRVQYAAKQQQAAQEKYWNSTEIDGESVDLANLNFNYTVKGDRISWRPERVYDDGRQMFIRFPAAAKNREMPVLLARKGKQDVLVNYRVKDSGVIVDGVFDRLALVIGVGRAQEKVEILRNGGN